MRPLGLVQSPKPDGITGTFLTVIQPASGPTLKEREKTYGEPTDEAKVRGNLGIAYVRPRPNRDAYENTLKAGATVLHLRRKCRANCHASRPTHSEVIQQTGSDGVQPHFADAEPKTNPSLRDVPQENPSRSL